MPTTDERRAIYLKHKLQQHKHLNEWEHKQAKRLGLLRKQ